MHTYAHQHTDPRAHTDIDECASNPCEHGVCSDLVNGYACTCKPGYEGDRCQLNIDECAVGGTSQCQNSVCLDNPGSYTCVCNLGFEGPFCTNS